MKKILLAGGAGYIGTELTKRLLKLNYDVVELST
jgi:nucleoside-diphosphate-sugar epimerase